MRYNRLPPRVKRALDRSSLSAIVLLAESDKEKSGTGQAANIDIRRFIFDRLNTGGRKLNPQELRNAIYPGEFNKAIVEMARFGQFTGVFGIPPYTEAEPNDYYENPQRQRNALYSTMGDCQLVLRFFALRDDVNIRGSMKSMLDRAMESRMSVSKADAAQLKNDFAERFDVAVKIFGPHPFLLPADERGNQRMSAGLYDAAMVAVDRLWDHREKLVASSHPIKGGLHTQLSDETKIPLLTGKTSTAQSVKDRIALMEAIMREGSGL